MNQTNTAHNRPSPSPSSSTPSSSSSSSFSSSSCLLSLQFQSLYSHCIVRSYRLAYSAAMDLWLCTLLFLIRQLQIISLLVVYGAQNTSYDILKDVPNLAYIFQASKIAVLEFNTEASSVSMANLQLIAAQTSTNLYIGIALSSAELAMLALLLLPLPSINKQINKVISKIITIGNIVLVIPTCLFMTKLVVILYNTTNVNNNSINSNGNGEYSAKYMTLFYVSLALSIIAFLVMLINYVLYTNFHFAFSLKEVTKNSLVRFPSSLHRQCGWLLIALLYRFSLLLSYPNLFIAYLVLYLMIALYQAKRYAVNFEYFDARITRNLGIMNLFNVTMCIALLSYYFGIDLFINSLTAFIIAFYLFFINFFLTFRKFWIKRIIIDDNTTTEVSQITYVSTFIIFETDRSDKKNQTYLSSLLKNHCNNCQQTDCCCKNRNTLYDPSKGHRGDTNLQPHLDLVFVKHFYFKMIQDSIIEFQKSINLKMMLCLYYLQFLSLGTEVIKNIKYFNRKMVVDKLRTQQKFALFWQFVIYFSLEQQFFNFVQSWNLSKGDQKIQNLKQFDQYFNTLVQKIITVSQNLKYFWSSMQTPTPNHEQPQKQKKQINTQFLSLLSTKTLQLMTQIQWIYKQMIQINPSSVELREIMFFYAKDIVNDMDLFIRIKEDLKMENFMHKNRKGNDLNMNNNRKSRNQDGKRVLNVYGNKTANFVISDINTIKWASNNAKLIFGYKLNSTLLKTAITSLMPPFFARTHDSNVKHFIQTGICTKMNNTKVIWCRRQNGSCFKAYIYIKIMVNYNVAANSGQKDIEFYTSIQSIGHNYIVCGMDGEIYGCDQSLKDLFRCPIKFMQNYRPNIQVFFPALFEQFFNYFYKDSTQNKQKIIEVQCSGYIPGKIAEYIENLAKQKQNFFLKNKKSRIINQLYGFFLEIKMQQLTMEIKGRYLTVYFEIEKSEMMGRQLVVLKINKVQHDAVEKYFQQFQKSIKQMLVFKEKLNTKRENSAQFSKKFEKHLSSNPFQFCLNPNKLRRVSKNMLQPIVVDKQPIKIKNNQAALDIRRQRAINQKVVIKNERVKQNIYKIKKLMYQQKVFSANTLKILTQARESHHIEQSDEDYNQEETENMKSTINQKLQNLSQDELLDDQNDQHTIQKFTHNQNQNQNQNGGIEGEGQAVSFQQSTTSSAAFISLSTKIKLLKEKLRQIKPTRLLILCTVLFIMLVLAGLTVYSVELVQKFIYREAATIEKQQSFGTFRLMQSLMNLKLLNNHQLFFTSNQSTINNNNSNNLSSTAQSSLSSNQTKILQSLFTIISLQELLRNVKSGNKIELYQIRPNYNSKNIVSSDGINITMQDFILKELILLGHQQNINDTDIIKHQLAPQVMDVRIGLSQYGQMIAKIYEINNQEQDGMPTPILLYFIPLIACIQALAFVNLYISSQKGHVIAKLISELYPHERRKYAKIFSKITQKMTLMLKFINIMNQTASNSNLNNKSERKQNPAKPQKHLSLTKNPTQQSHQQSLIKRCFILICVVFSLFYLTILTAYKVQQQIAVQISHERAYFHNFMIAKMKLTYQLIALQDTLLNNDTINPQQSIDGVGQTDSPAQILAQVYNSQRFTEDLKQDILHYGMMDMCGQLNTQNILSVGELSLGNYDYLDQVESICGSVTNSSFKRGVLQSYSYLSQSIQYYSTVQQQYSEGWPTQNLTNIVQTSLISTLLSVLLCRHFIDEQVGHDSLLFYVKIGMLVLSIAMSTVMLVIWKIVHDGMAQLSSMHNCYLLMIPFDLLNENPYLRQFLKQELQFKYNIY